MLNHVEMPPNKALHLPPILDQSERPLVAESCPSFNSFSHDLNDCFREKRTYAFAIQAIEIGHMKFSILTSALLSCPGLVDTLECAR
jgi:hypothetical protein